MSVTTGKSAAARPASAKPRSKRQSNGNGNIALDRAFDIEGMAEASYAFMHTATDMSQAWMTGLADLNGEFTHFVSDRLRQDLELPSKIAKCGKVSDVYEVYTDFFETAYKQYSEEAVKLASIGSRFSETAMQAIRDQEKEVSDSID